MRAVVCHEFAPIDQLVIEERPDPRPGTGKVVVAVRAAGVNFVDGLFVQGRDQIKPPLPFTPGGEVAGDVVAVGEAVESVTVGDPSDTPNQLKTLIDYQSVSAGGWKITT